MNEFTGQFYEIEQLEKENKRLKAELKKIRDTMNGNLKKNNSRIRELEMQIIKGLQSKGKDSIEYKGKVYHARAKIRHVRKSEKVKKEEIMNVLKETGEDEEEIENIYDKLSKAMRGDEHLEWSLK